MFRDKSESTTEPDLPLTTPLFDDTAAAKARPVEPLPSNRFYAWLTKGSARDLITTRARTFALIVIAGLASGTLGGIALVKHADNSEQRSESSITSESGTGHFETIEGGVAGVPGITPAVMRRPNVYRMRINPRRAYRVAVIH